MTPVETARRLLTDSPGEALCDACLAFASSTSLMEIRQITEDLQATADFHRRDRCESCRRNVPSVAYVPKCARCSYPVEARRDALMLDGETFHAACVRVLASAEAIRTSGDLTRQSRRLVERARRQMRPSPVEPAGADVSGIGADRVRRILMDAPGDPLCDLCLMAAAQLSLETIRGATAVLLTDPDEFKRGYNCAGCHRSVTSIFYRAKCADCAVRLHDTDKGFRMGEEIFHVVCLRRLISDDTIRLSRNLGRRCRRLIDQARRRLARGYEGPPLESP